jgi:hypothetical protein
LQKKGSENIVEKEKKTPHGVIELRKDNILVFRPDTTTFKEYNLEILKYLRDEFIDITEGIPRPYMADNSHITGIINMEEKEFINKHNGDFATEMAIITNSPVMNVLVNTYNNVFNPKVKVKLFKTEMDAVKWLLNHSE